MLIELAVLLLRLRSATEANVPGSYLIRKKNGRSAISTGQYYWEGHIRLWPNKGLMPTTGRKSAIFAQGLVAIKFKFDSKPPLDKQLTAAKAESAFPRSILPRLRN